MTAHVSGLPVEDVLPALMSGGGAFLLWLTALRARLRPDRETVRRHRILRKSCSSASLGVPLTPLGAAREGRGSPEGTSWRARRCTSWIDARVRSATGWPKRC